MWTACALVNDETIFSLLFIVSESPISKDASRAHTRKCRSKMYAACGGEAGASKVSKGLGAKIKKWSHPQWSPDVVSFPTGVQLLFLIGFSIGPPKMHRRFRTGPPKIHRRFCIGPPQVTHNLFLTEFHGRWILVYHGCYARKATKLPIWNRMTYHIKNQNYGTELPYGLCLLYKYWTHSHGLESNNTLQYHS